MALRVIPSTSTSTQFILLNGATPITLTAPTLQAVNSVDSYTQISLQNKSNTANASADFIAYGNNSTDVAGWMDMGFTSQSFSQAAYAITGANEGYLFMSAPASSGTSGDMVIATDSTGLTNSIHFGTNGFGSQANKRITIRGTTGHLGIGTTLPTHSLTLSSTSTGFVYYNTSDQTTNYERLETTWVSSVLNIFTTIGGSATARIIRIGTTSSAGGNVPTRYIEYGNAGSLVGISIQSTNSQASGSIFSVISGSNLTAPSGLQYGISVAPTIAQTATAGYTALLVNPTISTTGSGVANLLDLQLGSASKFRVNSAGLVDFVGSTIASAIAVASTHKLTINVNGVTYYLLATNV